MKAAQQILPALGKAAILVAAASATTFAVQDVEKIQQNFMPPASDVPVTPIRTGVYVSQLVINGLILAGCVYLWQRLD